MAELLQHLASALADRYALKREIGRGGMAFVYLATDLRHDREIAIKVLKPELAAVIGAERFLAEIRTTAHLQHPHILPLYDSGQAGSLLYFVMPYVEGESLRKRIDREAQLPVGEATRIAVQVAGALEYAHGEGVIHRDVKPSNILLQRGEPVVADFGIALAVGIAGGTRLTETGLSLGTPSYMSPEQLLGDREPDRASDIYSLGAVLYEMLVGHAPYTGPTAQAIVAQALTGEFRPPSVQRPAVPPNVDAAVRRSLERIPADRFGSTGEFAAALTDPSFRHGQDRETERRRTRHVLRVAAIAAVSAVVGAVGWSLLDSASAPDPPVVRYVLALPEGEELLPGGRGGPVAISPDGEWMAYVGPSQAQTGQQLWLRGRAQLRGRAIQGTEGATSPFFSPDGRRLGFVTLDGKLKVVSVDEGSVLVLADSAVAPVGGAWGADGFIYVAGGANRRGILRVPVRGGAVEGITTADLGPEVLAHAYPQWLPDGRGLLFVIVRNALEDDIAIFDLHTGEQRVLVHGEYARYASTGHLIWSDHEGAMRAAPFDLRSLRISAEGTLVGELTAGLRPHFAISRTGRLAYRERPPLINKVVWLDREGRESEVDSAQSPLGMRFVAVTPDGTRLAMSTYNLPRDDGQVFIKQLPTGPLERLTFEGDINYRPEWLPDGTGVTFISDRGGNRDVWTRRIDRSQPARLLIDEEAPVDEAVYTPDGRWLLYRRGMQDGTRDIWVMPDGGLEGRPLISTRHDEFAPTISPDGRWVVFGANEEGQNNIYVRPFPAADRQWRVSTNGGRGPVWARDGSELYYVNDREEMVAVRVYREADELTFSPEEVLFSATNYRTDLFHRSYDVSPDGRFVAIREYEKPPDAEDLVVVENWFGELMARLKDEDL